MREPGSVTVTLSRAEVEQLRWLRGGVYALDALLNCATELDSESLRRLNVAGLAYLTNAMACVFIDGPLNRLIGDNALLECSGSAQAIALTKKSR